LLVAIGVISVESEAQAVLSRREMANSIADFIMAMIETLTKEYFLQFCHVPDASGRESVAVVCWPGVEAS
jgi:hypothetical protein